MDKIITLCKIREIYRAIAGFEAAFEKRYNLCLNEGMLLCVLNTKGRLSSGEIAEELGLSFSNTSKLISSVEKKDLVNRVLGKLDKRHMYFTLNSKGAEVLAQIKCEEIELPDMLRTILDQQEPENAAPEKRTDGNPEEVA